jgi:Bacterial Ig domain
MSKIPVNACATKWVTQSSWLLAALPLVLLSVSPATALDNCNVAGQPQIFGANWNAAFAIRSGGGCVHSIPTEGGVIRSAEIAQHPQHGTLKLLDNSTWVYEARPGYNGRDSFTIKATGQSSDESPGTSLIQWTVTVE